MLKYNHFNTSAFHSAVNRDLSGTQCPVAVVYVSLPLKNNFMAEDNPLPTVHANDQTLKAVQVIWEGFHLELHFISHHQIMLLIYVFIIYNILYCTF